MKNLILLSVLLVVLSVFLTGCTLHFKATNMELDTEHTPRILKNSERSNTTYALTSIDIAK